MMVGLGTMGGVGMIELWSCVSVNAVLCTAHVYRRVQLDVIRKICIQKLTRSLVGPGDKHYVMPPGGWP
jgi:hypothetical protein